MKILGYVELYIRIDTEELEPSYMKCFMDFRKPLTRRCLKSILRNNKNAMEILGYTVTNVDYVSKEEYLNSHTEETYRYEFGENDE